jgi:hypothetical protein
MVHAARLLGRALAGLCALLLAGAAFLICYATDRRPRATRRDREEY